MFSFSNFTEKFRRVTSSGNYLPEIDGLRFIAIFMVVCILHIGGAYAGMMLGDKAAGSNMGRQIINEGGYGVSLFFIISGFILSVPFAKQYLYAGPAVSIKEYFLRRLTRIEPLYVVTLILYFILRVWVLHYQSFHEVLPHFFASLFYVHSIVYDDFSLVNAVTWSLEVEIQFYLLAPLLALLYLIQPVVLRRSVFIALIIAGGVISFQQYHSMGNIINMGYNFFAGMLLSDLYLANKKNYDAKGFTLIAVILLLAMLLMPTYTVSVYFCIAKIFLTTGFFFLAVTNVDIRRWLGNKYISVIGGMCYSIYLLHMGVHGVLRHYFETFHFTGNARVNGWLVYIITICAVLAVSAAFFLLIEKPTMNKYWYKKIFRKKENQVAKSG